MSRPGSSVLATQLASAGDKIRKELGVVTPPVTRTENENFLAHLRVKLGDKIFDDAWSSGQVLSLEQAVSLAMKDLDNSNG